MNKPDSGKSYQRTLVAAIDAELGVRRWSRRHLADVSGINSQTLDRVFLLRRDMNIEQLSQISHALGLEPEDIVTRAREWAERATPDDAVDGSNKLTERQKAALKRDIADATGEIGNTGQARSELPARRVRKRPAG